MLLFPGAPSTGKNHGADSGDTETGKWSLSSLEHGLVTATA